MAQTYEIEIKSLLGEKEEAEKLRSELEKLGAKELGKHSQLNHYFNLAGDIKILAKRIAPHIPEFKQGELLRIVEDGSDHSVRTREADGAVYIVVKASVGDDTSANGVSRIEFESKVDMTLDELDGVLLDSGLEYQAKWSREREEFRAGDMNITIDKNAGYGYLAEFEKVTSEGSDIKMIENEIRDFMKTCGVEELAQERLERMFAHYNSNWEDYYGTDKVFVID